MSSNLLCRSFCKLHRAQRHALLFGVWRAAFGAAAVLASGLCVPPWAAAQDMRQGRSPAMPLVSDALAAAAVIEQALVDAIERAEGSVVCVVSRNTTEELQREFQPNFMAPGQIFFSNPEHELGAAPDEFGSGVVVDARGLILTSYHALDLDADQFVIAPSRRTYRARIRAADPRSDLAVIEVIGAVGAGEFSPITMGDASALRKGQLVVALGNPYAIARDGQASASFGIVSNLTRKLGPLPQSEAELSNLHHLGTLIQTDAKLNLGTSGGALVNLRGEMVGLTTSLAATSGYEQAAGYAVPIDATFKQILQRLKEGREVEYGLLGVVPTPSYDSTGRPARGARLSVVRAGTPAHRAGLQPNDLVTHVNGVPLIDGDSLRLEVGRLLVPATVKLTIERSEQSIHIDVPLAKFPVTGRQVVTVEPPRWRGLQVDYPTAVLASDFLNEQSEEAVAVRDVVENSPCSQAALTRGMLITHVGRTKVTTPEEFRRAVDATPDSDHVTLQVVKGYEKSEPRSVAPE